MSPTASTPRAAHPTQGRARRGACLLRAPGLACGLALIAGLAPAVARAEADHRPGDRFFVGVGVGGAEAPRAPLVGDYMSAVAYETSFWPSDHVGLGGGVAAIGEDTYDLAAHLVLAVPLRWVQPYAGVMAGYRTTPMAVTERVHLVAGVNAYASRDLRVFVELRDPAQLTLLGGDHAPHVLAGVRWSPEAFHRARAVVKVDAVWWSLLLSAGAWTAATLAR